MKILVDLSNSRNVLIRNKSFSQKRYHRRKAKLPLIILVIITYVEKKAIGMYVSSTNYFTNV